MSLALVGCRTPERVTWQQGNDDSLGRAGHEVVKPARPSPAMSVATEVALPAGPQPVDVFIRAALAENRSVRAARLNVQALQFRIPQVTSLDDPVLSNTIFPIPSVAPQYSLMGYMPYSFLLAQQFPWCGTLSLRGKAAEQDVKVALFELAAAQLDVVANVKRAYHDLAFAQRAEAILQENRKLADEFVTIARERYKSGGATQTDVLRSESAVSDIDRELEVNRQNIAEARADLARLLHANPESEFQALPETPSPDLPGEVNRLYLLAIASRPDLQGRLATIERDQTGVELARKRFLPNVTLGMVYQDMEKTNAVTPRTASGMPNVGLFVGFNLPVYRKRVAAGVGEAQTRAAADSALYEAERDQAHREVKNAFSQVRTQRNILDLLRTSNLPRSRQILDAATSDYRTGAIDYLSLLGAWREVLQVELQVAQVETELAKALATLEGAVGIELNNHPIDPAAHAPAGPPPPEGRGPFPREDPTARPERSLEPKT